MCQIKVILTHGNAKQANGNLDTRNDVKSICNASLDEPVKRTPSQSKTKYVLKD
jgi:hypothetical protein